jgi:hypothetical protein
MRVSSGAIARASESCRPPGGTGSTMCTGRIGYVCAIAADKPNATSAIISNDRPGNFPARALLSIALAVKFDKRYWLAY